MSAITRQEERVLERKGFLIAVIFHAVLLLIFFFWIVLKKTDGGSGGEGQGMAGVPINFGFNEMGSGDNNSTDPVATQAGEVPQETQPSEASTDDANLTTTDPNAETVVSDTKKASTQTTTTNTNPNQTTTQTTNPNAKMGSTTKTGVSNGDGDSKQAGNQGSPNGTLDSKNYYGNGGNGGTGGPGTGTGLSMAGWHLEKPPVVENPQKEPGKVVFTITIDSEGEILSLRVKEKTVSDALVKKCEYEIRNEMEFVKNTNNASTAPSSTGEITFLFHVN